ncbi:MAG: type II secretion system protein [Acidaminococcaceae bacterium]|nr:type II secretion system protein [Acidaminococcaceae bacterium]
MLKRYKLWVARAKQRRGFTLVEVMAVMAIIAVLAISFIPSVNEAMDRSKDTTLKTDLAAVGGAIKIYQLDNGGGYPASLDVLKKEKYISNNVDISKMDYKADTGIATAKDSKDYTLSTDGGRKAPDAS